MNDFDIPIFKKTYELYKEFYICLGNFPRQDRYALGQRCELCILEILELFIAASQAVRDEKLSRLLSASVRLNMARVHIRLAKDLKVLDMKKYILLQECIDEIGRMLGSWIKMVRARN